MRSGRERTDEVMYLCVIVLLVLSIVKGVPNDDPAKVHQQRAHPPSWQVTYAPAIARFITFTGGNSEERHLIDKSSVFPKRTSPILRRRQHSTKLTIPQRSVSVFRGRRHSRQSAFSNMTPVNSDEVKHSLKCDFAQSETFIQGVSQTHGAENRIMGKTPNTLSKNVEYSSHHGLPNVNMSPEMKPIPDYYQRQAKEDLNCKYMRTKGGIEADCSRRHLTIIPYNLRTDITVLNLYDNKIKHLPPGNFSRYPLLVKINLDSNLIANISEESFCGLSNLKILVMADNKLNFNDCSSLCCQKPFRPLQNLSHLNIRRNLYHLLPTALDICLKDLRNLESLMVTFVDKARFGVGFQKLTKLKSLDLSESSLLTYIDSDFFNNLQTLPVTNLSLAKSRLSQIHADALASFPVLQALDISHNMLLGLQNASAALKILGHSKLNVLFMNRLSDPAIHDTIIVTKPIFENLQNISLRELYMDFNSIAKIEEAALNVLPQSIQTWSLRKNNLAHPYHFLKPLLRLVNLEVLDAQDQSAWIPKDSLKSGNSPTWNTHQTFIVPVPQKLKRLRFTNANSYYFPSKYVHFENNSLTHLYYNGNGLRKFSVWITGLEKIEVLDLGYNQMVVKKGFFDGFTGLRYLYLYGNSLNKSFSVDREGVMLGNANNLLTLDLGKNEISKLHPKVFKNNSMLQVLSLQSNKLVKLGCRIKHMTRLEKLDISKNSFAYLRQSEIKDLEAIAEKHPIKVNIHQNPLVCSCETLYFLKWATSLQENLTLFGFNKSFCLFENGTHLPLRDASDIIRELEIRCASYVGLMLSLSIATIAMILVLSGSLMYRYRWKLRYIYHVRLLRRFLRRYNQPTRHGYMPINGDDPDKYYDVFVAYADEDSEFVTGDMLRVLGENHLSMYIRDRDSVPGLEIATNITRAVSQSRTTVLLLSRNFLRNKWCNYEFQIARVEGVNRRCTIVLNLMFEQVPAEEIPDDLLNTMKSGKFIERPNTESQEDMEAFWTMLVQAIRDLNAEQV